MTKENDGFGGFGEMRSALGSVLTSDQIKRLTQELSAGFQGRLDVRIDHLLANYARHPDSR